jgi:uncharacterized coiled-coil DUF342 family protein
MNQQRRDKINELVGKANELQSEINAIRDEEQEYRDNMPESLASGEKGDKADEVIGQLESAADSVGTVIEELESAVA